MKVIRLDKMTIANFKGIRQLELAFGGQNQTTVLSGGNGVGKSTVKNAYLWCLFGVTQNSKSSTIQPLDKLTNQVVHNLTTSVSVRLEIEGTPVVFKRELYEKWSVPRGKVDAVFKGTETACYINEVPYTLSKYYKKIEDILDIESWLMMSNVGYFLTFSQKERRQWLDELSGEINTDVLLSKYPVVAEAFRQGKSLEEIKRELAAAKSKSKLNLEEIPARYDELEKLRVDIDKESLLSEQKVLETQISTIDEQIAGLSDERLKQVIDEIKVVRLSLSKMEDEARYRRQAELSHKREVLDKYTSELYELTSKHFALKNDLDRIGVKIVTDAALIQELGQKWKEKNKQKPDYDSIDTECPLCHRPFDDNDLQEKLEEMVKSFNEDKMKTLRNLEEEALKKKEGLVSMQKDYDEKKAQIDELSAKIEDLTQKKNEASIELGSISTTIPVPDSPEYSRLLAELDSKTKEREELALKQTNSLYTLNESKKQLQKSLDDVKKSLSQEDVNNRIDVQQKALELQKKEIAKALSEIDGWEQQVRMYEKSYIELLENTISAKFKMVKWRFYDRNITNDGEKEICEAIVDGVPASSDNLNQGATINAGIDIINAFAEHYGVSIPLFVDCTESVEKLIETNCQLIALEVVKGQKLLTLNIK